MEISYSSCKHLNVFKDSPINRVSIVLIPLDSHWLILISGVIRAKHAVGKGIGVCCILSEGLLSKLCQTERVANIVGETNVGLEGLNRLVVK